MLKSRFAVTRVAVAAGAVLMAHAAGALPIWNGSAGDGNWSTGGNWTTGFIPVLADTPIFGTVGSGGTETVDTNFIVSGLTYNGNSTHTTIVAPGKDLGVRGQVSVGVGDPTAGGSATWSGGGSVTIGASAAPRNLWVGVNDSTATSGANTSSLNLQSASVGGFVADLSIGRKTAFTSGNTYGSGANGSLTLGSASTLTVGTSAARASVNVGMNQQSSGTATGTLDASRGNLTIFASTMSVGVGNGGGAPISAAGTVTTGTHSSVDANTITIGSGTNAHGTVNLDAGTVKAGTINVASGGTFNFTGGRLSVGTFNGVLNQMGGVLAPGSSPGISTLNNGYHLASAGTLEIELNGTTVGTGYDQLVVKGLVDLNADSGLGGLLDVKLGFAAHIGDSYRIINNDGTDAVIGHFQGHAQNSQFDEVLGQNAYTFKINYAGGDGNDVVLNLTNIQLVPEPGTVAMWLAGLFGMAVFKVRRGRLVHR